MAIYKPSAGGVPRGSLPGATLTVGGGGQPVMWTPTSNRLVPTPAFALLDQLILSLDAQFDALPDQAPWFTYAAAIADHWQLCANCNPASTGKKLFRQYNFNRHIIGLPPVAAPASYSETSDIAYIEMSLVIIPPAGSYIIISTDPQPTACLVTAQVGAVLSNPSILIPALAFHVNIPEGSAAYARLYVTRSTGAPWFCQSTVTGSPGVRVLSTWTN